MNDESVMVQPKKKQEKQKKRKKIIDNRIELTADVVRQQLKHIEDIVQEQQFVHPSRHISNLIKRLQGGANYFLDFESDIPGCNRSIFDSVGESNFIFHSNMNGMIF
jgi:hypothetical protein